MKIENILVIRHGSFGDIMRSDGAFRDIRAHHSEAEITLLTTPPYLRLMECCPHFDKVMLDERAPYWQVGRNIALCRALRQAGFHKVYDLQKSDRTKFYRRVVLNGVPWSGRKSRKIPLIGKRIHSLPGLADYALQLEIEGIAATHTLQPDLSWMVEDMAAFIEEAGLVQPYIVLIAGSSVSLPHKRWPYYAELAAQLIKRGYQVVTAPGPDELELSNTIPGVTLLNRGNVLNWFELAGILRGAAFVVGNDTGPSHVASGLNCPGLVLFGSHASVEQTGIKRGRFAAIEVEDLRRLSVERVLDEVLRRLDVQPY